MNTLRCSHAASGCNGPVEAECMGLCDLRPSLTIAAPRPLLDSVVARTMPGDRQVFFTASHGFPRWVSDVRFAERYTPRGALSMADALVRFDGKACLVLHGQELRS